MHTVIRRSLAVTVAMETLFFLAGAAIYYPATTNADSGVIQLQQIPSSKDESEGSDFVPPGADSNLVDSSGIGTNGFGTVVLTKIGNVQDFLVRATSMPQGANAFNFAYGVFLNDAPRSTNFNLIGVMDLISPSKKKPRWSLHYSQTGGPPPQLGVTNITDLAGLELRIMNSPLTGSNSVTYLHAILPPVVSNPKALSGSKTIAMSLPAAGLGSPPSPDARGTLTVKYDAVHGRTIISIRTTKLARGTGYAVFLEDAVGAGVYQELEELNEPKNFPNNSASGFLTLDTKVGNPIDFFAHTPNDLTGRKIVVVDPFFDAFNPLDSSVHLIAIMPSIP